MAVVLSAFFLLAGAGTMEDRFTQDLVEQGDLDAQDFQLIGGDLPARYCTPDPAGLHLTIPAGDPAVSFCGLEAEFVVRGDFEITAGYEVLDLPEPEGGHGAGLKISIKDSRKEWASLQRLHGRNAGHFYSAHRAEMKEGEYKHSSEITPTEATWGRLRLKRTGTTLQYLVAEGGSDQFVELRQAEFTDGDLAQLYFAAQTGGSPTSVDVAWTDLDVRAEELVRSSYQPAEKPPVWPIVLFATVLALVILVAGIWRWVRRRQAVGGVARPTHGAVEERGS